MSQALINDTTALLPSSRQYTKSGIGGAGNIRKSTTLLSTPATPRTIPTPTRGSFLTGIGGAGNSRTYSERASITFDEELARRSAQKQSVATSGSWHHGIGGAGNRATYTDSSTSSSVESSSFFVASMASNADRMKERVVSYLSVSKSRKSSLDEKEVDSMSIDGRESWSKEN